MTVKSSYYGKCLVDAYSRCNGEENISPDKVFALWKNSVERFNGLATDEDVMDAIKAEIAIRKEGFMTLRG